MDESCKQRIRSMKEEFDKTRHLLIEKYNLSARVEQAAKRRREEHEQIMTDSVRQMNHFAKQGYVK